jgi:excisionase family DNA binding protein
MSDAKAEASDQYAHRLLLRVAEAADILAVSRGKMYQVLRSGEVESVLLGGCRRVPRDALDAFVTGLRSEGVDDDL